MTRTSNSSVTEIPAVEGLGTDQTSNDPKKTGTLEHYFCQLRHLEPLPPEEQNRLARRFQEEEDEQAGQKLIATNLRLVVKLAYEYKKDWSELPDLIQAGNLGLAEALQKYDPDRGVQFISYAQYWIRALMMSFLKNSAHPVKMYSTRAGRQLFYHLEKTKKKLRKNGKKPTAERIAEELDIDEKDVRQIGANLKEPPLSLDKEVLEDGSATFGDLLTDPRQDPEKHVEEFDIAEKVREFVEDFTEQLDDERKRDIWLNRTTSTDPETLRDLGDKWGVSKERIRQVEVQILKEVKRQLEKDFGSELKSFVSNDGFTDFTSEPTFV
jgi:RNA polymerase sigma-32 factor